MEYASEATLPQGVAIGTHQHHHLLDARTYFLVMADDKGAADALIGRAIAPHAAAHGSFHFNVDETHSWFRATDLGYQPEALRPFVQAAIDLPRHLGSIRVEGMVLAFRDDNLHSFWIETTEGDKRRVTSGVRQTGIFSPFPEGWAFSAPALAREIAQLY